VSADLDSMAHQIELRTSAVFNKVLKCGPHLDGSTIGKAGEPTVKLWVVPAVQVTSLV
jgi:hypothetical protein